MKLREKFTKYWLNPNKTLGECMKIRKEIEQKEIKKSIVDNSKISYIICNISNK
jgi:hypothetical protein